MTRICTFIRAGVQETGILEEGKIIVLNSILSRLGCGFRADSVAELLAAGPEGLMAVETALRYQAEFPDCVLAEQSVKLSAPVPRPGKILCLAGNYLKHLAQHHGVSENQVQRPEDIHVFTKCGNAVLGPSEDIVVSRRVRKLDYELELGIVIGKEGRYIPEDRAREHIGGYVVANDVSARDYMPAQPGGRVHWFAMKSQDGFCPFGPALLLRDSVDSIHSLQMEIRVNGEIRQQVDPAEMIFSPEEIISRISRWMTLSPGDLILTGTPAGDAWSRGVFLSDGDLVEASMAHVGRLVNRIRFEDEIYRFR